MRAFSFLLVLYFIQIKWTTESEIVSKSDNLNDKKYNYLTKNCYKKYIKIWTWFLWFWSMKMPYSCKFLSSVEHLYIKWPFWENRKEWLCSFDFFRSSSHKDHRIMWFVSEEFSRTIHKEIWISLCTVGLWGFILTVQVTRWYESHFSPPVSPLPFRNVSLTMLQAAMESLGYLWNMISALLW